jgi:hypothetical protein
MIRIGRLSVRPCSAGWKRSQTESLYFVKDLLFIGFVWYSFPRADSTPAGNAVIGKATGEENE